jgi:hypothetical protein
MPHGSVRAPLPLDMQGLLARMWQPGAAECDQTVLMLRWQVLVLRVSLANAHVKDSPGAAAVVDPAPRCVWRCGSATRSAVLTVAIALQEPDAASVLHWASQTRGTRWHSISIAALEVALEAARQSNSPADAWEAAAALLRCGGAAACCLLTSPPLQLLKMLRQCTAHRLSAGSEGPAQLNLRKHTTYLGYLKGTCHLSLTAP